MSEQAYRDERADLLREAEARSLSREERERLRLLSLHLGESSPDDESLTDLAKAARAGAQDARDTEPPPAALRRVSVGGFAMQGPRALSSTLSDVFTARLGAVLEELDRRGYGPRGPREGTLAARGRTLFHHASELRSIFDGLAAAQRIGLQSALVSDEDRRVLYHRVSEVERELGAFLNELRDA